MTARIRTCAGLLGILACASLIMGCPPPSGEGEVVPTFGAVTITVHNRLDVEIVSLQLEGPTDAGYEDKVLEQPIASGEDFAVEVQAPVYSSNLEGQDWRVRAIPSGPFACSDPGHRTSVLRLNLLGIHATEEFNWFVESKSIDCALCSNGVCDFALATLNGVQRCPPCN